MRPIPPAEISAGSRPRPVPRSRGQPSAPRVLPRGGSRPSARTEGPFGPTLRSALLTRLVSEDNESQWRQSCEPSSTTVPARRPGKRRPTRSSPTTPTPSSGSTRSPSAAPTCTSSRATCPRSPPAGSSATRRSGPSSEAGDGVRRLCPGDRVLVSCITACGSCRYCREARYGQCLGGGGWILGHTIDGTQAEYVRVPFADTSTYRIPDGVSDEDVLMLADILPTGYEVGVLNGRRAPRRRRRRRRRGPGRAGRHHRRAALQPEPHRGHRPGRRPARGGQAVRRRRHRQQLPRGPAQRHRSSPGGSARTSRSRPSACRPPSSWRSAWSGPAATSRTSACTARPATLHLEDLWIRDITITTGLVDTYSTPTLLRLITAGQIDAGRFVTHHFDLDEFDEAYDVFARAADTDALKVVLTRGE